MDLSEIKKELPLFVALDVDTLKEARRTMHMLSGHVDAIKIGPKLYSMGGTYFLKEVMDRGFKLFLDLKLYDIPNTVRLAVESLADIGLFCLTLHASGGRRMMEEAIAARDKLGSATKLIGITVLTSFDDEGWGEVFPGQEVQSSVKRLAKLCSDCGMDGLVCSPLDLPLVKPIIRPDCITIVPGVRMGNKVDDQSRVATPKQAFQNGADYIVMGRPIYQSKDVRRVIREIKKSLEEPVVQKVEEVKPEESRDLVAEIEKALYERWKVRPQDITDITTYVEIKETVEETYPETSEEIKETVVTETVIVVEEVIGVKEVKETTRDSKDKKVESKPQEDPKPAVPEPKSELKEEAKQEEAKTPEVGPKSEDKMSLKKASKIAMRRRPASDDEDMVEAAKRRLAKEEAAKIKVTEREKSKEEKAKAQAEAALTEEAKLKAAEEKLAKEELEAAVAEGKISAKKAAKIAMRRGEGDLQDKTEPEVKEEPKVKKAATKSITRRVVKAAQPKEVVKEEPKPEPVKVVAKEWKPKPPVSDGGQTKFVVDRERLPESPVAKYDIKASDEEEKLSKHVSPLRNFLDAFFDI